MPNERYKTKSGVIFEYDGSRWSSTDRKDYSDAVFLSAEGIKPTKELLLNKWMTPREILDAGNDPLTGIGGYLLFVNAENKVKMTGGLHKIVAGSDSEKPLRIKD